jgi:hypothetical protein
MSLPCWTWEEACPQAANRYNHIQHSLAIILVSSASKWQRNSSHYLHIPYFLCLQPNVPVVAPLQCGFVYGMACIGCTCACIAERSRDTRVYTLVQITLWKSPQRSNLWYTAMGYFIKLANWGSRTSDFHRSALIIETHNRLKWSQQIKKWTQNKIYKILQNSNTHLKILSYYSSTTIWSRANSRRRPTPMRRKTSISVTRLMARWVCVS